MRVRRLVGFVSLALLVLVLDQSSKAWARTLPPGIPQPVIDGFWDWQLAKNPGSAFSMFVGGDVARVLLSLVAIAAIVGVTLVVIRGRDRAIRVAAYAAIVGGAAGNLIDRVREGEVTDFVRWRAGTHTWPVFNVADIALVTGVIILILASVPPKRKIAA